MTARPCRLSARAQADVRGIQAWYDQQAPGLGVRFTTAVDATVERIAAQPELYQMRIADARRARVDGFPDYGLWYRVLPDQSVVFACVSGRRHDAIIRQRMLRII